MKHLSTGIDVEATPADVWCLLTRFAEWPSWGLSVRNVDSNSDRVAPGVTGRVKTVLGPWLPFAITEVEERREWHWKVAGFAATGHYLSETDSDACRVDFTVPWIAFAYLPVVRISLRRLKRIAEQG